MRDSESRLRSFVRFWQLGRWQISVITFLLASCAHVEPPPGGPVDKIPPYVVGVFPAPMQTEVGRDAAITLQFSEWVKSEGIQNRVALSPTLPGKIRVEPEGDRLVVRHDSLLRENTTYRMVIPTELKDMNGVPLDTAFQLVFSTGKTIDSGVLEGRLFQLPKGNYQQGWVALYSHSRQGLVARRGEKRKANWPDSLVQVWREKPTYLASIDSMGYFRFGALAPGRYGVLGFIDANQNQLPDNGETMGLGPAGVLIGSVTPPELTMRMAPIDTQKLRLTKVTWVPAGDSTGGYVAGALKISFNRFPAWNAANLLDAFMVAPAEVGQQWQAFRAQPEASGVSPEGELELWFPKLPAHQRLLVRATKLTDGEGLPLDTNRASLTFEALPQSGKSAQPWKWTLWNTDMLSQRPTPLSIKAMVPIPSVLVRGDRPVSDSLILAMQPKWKLKMDSTGVAVNAKREGPFGIRLTWALPKKAMKSFALTWMPDSLPNLADSLKQAAQPTKVGQWSVLDSASWSSLTLKVDAHWMGWTGVLRRDKSEEWRKLRLSSDKEIRIDSLTPGVWWLSVFADQNGNGQWNSGAVYPWQSQEPTSYWPDTLNLVPGKPTGPISVGPNIR